MEKPKYKKKSRVGTYDRRDRGKPTGPTRAQEKAQKDRRIELAHLELLDYQREAMGGKMSDVQRARLKFLRSLNNGK